ncbi:chorismate synthase [Thermotomaculum hydrothermale]|uniref:Chorismate synthase n=1 Tax=Thermotomaculum hydrothermale TaxID=981385 RepID=A0A7R6PH66_9BACT|nr:chorismate synthase [Thermotomaculum hydrothermale]BBB32529.1 chorismate synthase [Thermotomaculum hydrothermale]
MNSFGQIFRVTITGESHGKSIGVVIDGCPPGIPLKVEDFFNDLKRRKPGKAGTTKRIEDDFPLIESGVFNGYTTGSPILIRIENRDTRPKHYDDIKDLARPSHADFVAYKKYKGFNDYRGGGHFSGRITVGIVAAGVIAKKIVSPIEIKADIYSIGGKKQYEDLVKEVAAQGDSIGGIIECVCKNVPVGLGEPFFDSVESVISHLVFSIPGIKGIEFGAGFRCTEMRGSEFNDIIVDKSGKTQTNNSGGINGGITNGNDIVFRVAVRPTATIFKPQETINLKTGEKDRILPKGRHDSCIALRMPVIVEAMTAIALADLKLLSLKDNLF